MSSSSSIMPNEKKVKLELVCSQCDQHKTVTAKDPDANLKQLERALHFGNGGGWLYTGRADDTLCPECNQPEPEEEPEENLSKDAAMIVHPRHDQYYLTANGKQGTVSKPTYVMILDAARNGLLRALTGNEFKVLICMALHCDKNLTCWPSYGAIARETGLNRKTVIKLVGELIERGLVLRQFHYQPTLDGKQRQSSNRYQVSTPYLSRGEN